MNSDENNPVRRIRNSIRSANDATSIVIPPNARHAAESIDRGAAVGGKLEAVPPPPPPPPAAFWDIIEFSLSELAQNVVTKRHHSTPERSSITEVTQVLKNEMKKKNNQCQ